MDTQRRIERKKAEAKRLRRNINRRVENLKKLDDTPLSIKVVSENRKKYGAFDAETGRITATYGDIDAMTEGEVDRLLKQEKSWLGLKTSSVAGAKRLDKKRILSMAEAEGISTTQSRILLGVMEKIRDDTKSGGLVLRLDSEHEYQELFDEILKKVSVKSRKSSDEIYESLMADVKAKEEAEEKAARERAILARDASGAVGSETRFKGKKRGRR